VVLRVDPTAERLPGVTARAAGLGAVHALVDAACVFAVWETGASTAIHVLTTFWIVFGYDVLAFAGQVPLGALVDRLKATRAAALAGVALTTLALLLVRTSPVATMAAAGLGNALFHLGAGACVLSASPGRAGPAGIFVAPGALGLGLGMWMGTTGTGPAWLLIALLVLALPLVDALARPGRAAADDQPVPGPAPGCARPVALVALGLLLFSVLVRSYVGIGACHECPKGTLLLIGIPVAAFTGKLAGGLAADQLGWLAASVGALVASAPLIALNGGNPWLALGGLVPLVAVYRLMPGRPATAFGLPCLALVLGAIPTFFPVGRSFYGPAVFAALIVASAVALGVALRATGVRALPARPRRPAATAVGPVGAMERSLS
jgi:FSR family fosmidomycin resistance protein-like MFS transporter